MNNPMNQELLPCPRIYTRCPACHNDTLTINKGHLLCTWHECPSPTLIDTDSRTPLPSNKTVDEIARKYADKAEDIECLDAYESLIKQAILEHSASLQANDDKLRLAIKTVIDNLITQDGNDTHKAAWFSLEEVKLLEQALQPPSPK